MLPALTTHATSRLHAPPLSHSTGDSGLLRGLGDGPTRATKLLAAAGGRLQGRLQWLRGNATLGATEL